MKPLFLASIAVAAFASVAPVAQAAVLSIDDSSPSETLSLSVDQFNQVTTPATLPGGGSVIDITTPTPSNGISQINYSAIQETLSFKFDNQINWGSNVYLYRFYSEDVGGPSDLFVIQGFACTTPDYVTFISDPGPLSGNITDIVPALTNATPLDLGTVQETGDWQLAFDTGPDQYYIRSDLPEPATLAVLGVGLFGIGFARRKRR